MGKIDRFNQSKYCKKKGVIPIKVHTSPKKWGQLSPYHLKTKKGYIFENVWQFSKIYPKVDKVKLKKKSLPTKYHHLGMARRNTYGS